MSSCSIDGLLDFLRSDISKLVGNETTKRKLANVGTVLELVLDASKDRYEAVNKVRNETVFADSMANTPANQGKGYEEHALLDLVKVVEVTPFTSKETNHEELQEQFTEEQKALLNRIDYIIKKAVTGPDVQERDKGLASLLLDKSGEVNVGVSRAIAASLFTFLSNNMTDFTTVPDLDTLTDVLGVDSDYVFTPAIARMLEGYGTKLKTTALRELGQEVVTNLGLKGKYNVDESIYSRVEQGLGLVTYMVGERLNIVTAPKTTPTPKSGLYEVASDRTSVTMGKDEGMVHVQFMQLTDVAANRPIVENKATGESNGLRPVMRTVKDVKNWLDYKVATEKLDVSVPTKVFGGSLYNITADFGNGRTQLVDLDVVKNGDEYYVKLDNGSIANLNDLVKEASLEIRRIDGAYGNAVFVEDVRSLSNKFKEVYKLEDNKAPKTPLPAPVKADTEGRRVDTVDLTEKSKKVLAELNKVGYELSDGVAVLKELMGSGVLTADSIKESMGYVDVSGQENPRTRTMTYDAYSSQDAKNKAVTKMYDDMMEMIETGDDSKFYFNWFAPVNDRKHIDSNTVNPMADKRFTRWLAVVATRGMTVTYNRLDKLVNDVDTADHVNPEYNKELSFIYGVVQAFDGVPGIVSIDKNATVEDIISSYKKIASLTREERIDLVKKATMTQSEKKGLSATELKSYGKLDHVGHALMAIAELDKMDEGRAVGTEFAHKMFVEFDGKVNGYFIKLMQEPLGPHFMYHLSGVGVRPIKDKHLTMSSVGKEGDSREYDPYQFLGMFFVDMIRATMDNYGYDRSNPDNSNEAVTRNIDRAVAVAEQRKGMLGLTEKAKNEVFESLSPKDKEAFQKELDKADKLPKTLQLLSTQNMLGLVESRVNKALRDIAKDPTMIFNYGAGIRKIAASIVRDQMDELLNKMVSREFTYAGSMLDDGKYDDTVNMLKRYPNSMVVSKSTALLELQTGMEFLYGEAISHALNTHFGHYVEINNAKSGMTNSMFQIVKKLYQATIDYTIASEGSVVNDLSRERKKEILSRLLPLLPNIKGPSAYGLNEAIGIIAQDSTIYDPNGNVILQATAPGTKVNTVVTNTTLKAPDAKAPVVPTHVEDADLLADTFLQALAEGKDPFQMMHDAIIELAGANNSLSYNKNAIHTNVKYSVLQEFVDLGERFVSRYNEFYATLPEEIKAQMVQEVVGGEEGVVIVPIEDADMYVGALEKGKPIPQSIKEYRETLEKYQKEAQANRNKLFGNKLRIAQMGSTPGGVYSWDPEEYIEEAKTMETEAIKEYNDLVKDDRFKEVIEELKSLGKWVAC